MWDSLGILAIPLLVGLNGIFVAIEFALVSIRWTRVEQLVEQNVLGAKAVADAVGKLNDSLASIQLGITFTSLALGWAGEPALEHILAPMFANLPTPWDHGITTGIAVAIAFLSITYLHIVLGELVPRAIAIEHAERVAIWLSPPMLVWREVTRPLVFVMRGSGSLVIRLFRLPEPKPEQQVHSAEEIELLVDEGEEAGVIPADEAKYVRAVFELSDKRVRDVMVPRERVVTLSLRATEDEILETARETAHTRMPVWENDHDDIVGVVNTKDLFHVFSMKGLVILMDALYPAVFVSPDLAVSKCMNLFRREKRQMAVVRGAEGEFLGIVTLEDILEEIVGEIEDEHD